MKQTNRKADLPLLLLAVVLIFLIVCPVGMIFAKAVMQNGRLDFSPAVQTLLNPENAHMIGNSLLLGVLVVLLSTLIAAPLAYLFSRTKFARYRVFDILFMIPFMTPPYIASMGWILFMQKKGLLQQLIPAAAGCEKIFFTLGGLVLVMSLHVFSVHAHHAQKRHAEYPLQSGRGRCCVWGRILCPDAQDLSAAALRQLRHRCAAGVCENAV